MIAHLQRELSVANNWIEHHQNHVDDLIKENTTLRADKERLDYMEQNVDFVSWRFYGKPQPFDLRGTIDAKRKEAKP